MIYQICVCISIIFYFVELFNKSKWLLHNYFNYEYTYTYLRGSVVVIILMYSVWGGEKIAQFRAASARLVVVKWPLCMQPSVYRAVTFRCRSFMINSYEDECCCFPSIPPACFFMFIDSLKISFREIAALSASLSDVQPSKLNAEWWQYGLVSTYRFQIHAYDLWKARTGALILCSLHRISSVARSNV